ncbi:unnamed protein product [Prunus brigantina]
MIMDDMEVKPMSAISSIALIKNFDVRDVRSLEEIVVPLDKDKRRLLLPLSPSLPNKQRILRTSTALRPGLNGKTPSQTLLGLPRPA